MDRCSSPSRSRPAPAYGTSTLEETITGGDPAEAFQLLTLGPGEPYAVLTDLAEPRAGRERRRVSLAYFGHLSDFQLADEESPVRVEFLDPDPSRTASSAWRPQEALLVHQVDESVRAMNRFLSSPVPQGDGTRAADGQRRPDGRPRRQHAAQRDGVGREAARGRHARPEQRHRRPLGKLVPAGHAARRPGGLHRRAGLRRLLRVGFVLRPRRPGRPVRGLARVSGAHGPRAGAVRGRGAEGPVVFRLREPRRARAGERGRGAVVRGHRDRLREALQPGHHRARLGSRSGLPHDARRHVVHGSARRESPVRRQGAVQGPPRDGRTGRRPRLRARAEGGARGIARRGGVLLVEPGRRTCGSS